MARVINQHNQPNGRWCRWSGVEVSDTYARETCPGPMESDAPPCPDSRVLCPASEVKLGDCIDVTALPFELDEVTRMAGEFEYARIVEDSTPETPDCLVIHTEAGSFGVKPDLPLVLGPHQPDMAQS